MKELIEFIEQHTIRGECQCGKCCDKGPDIPAPTHSVNVHFFWVSTTGNPDRERFVELLEQYPEPERLKGGPSYLELGGVLGDQGLALKLIGLGELLGVWKAITPALFHMEGEEADALAGNGFIMAGGMRGATPSLRKGSRAMSCGCNGPGCDAWECDGNPQDREPYYCEASTARGALCRNLKAWGERFCRVHLQSSHEKPRAHEGEKNSGGRVRPRRGE